MDELTQKQKKRAIDAYFAIKLIAGNPNNDTRIFAVYAAGMADARAALAEPQGEPEPAKQDAAVEAVSRVRTSFINPPIPIRAFDWVAWIDGEEESMRYGYGRTEQEARDELSNVLAEYDEENRK